MIRAYTANMPQIARPYIPTLDGWRAVAIISVVLFHDFVHQIGWFSTYWLQARGAIGVDLFFAISGILICTLLLEEEKQTGTISLQSFYLRRAFRILPPALIFLATLAILQACRVIPPIHKDEFLGCIFFFRNLNIFRAPSWLTVHFWSLSVEEHFYFILPAFLLLCKRYRARALLGGGVALIAVGMVVYPHYASESDFRLGPLFIAASTAVALQNDKARALMSRFLSPGVFLGAIGLMIRFLFTGRSLVLGFLMSGLVASTLLKPTNFVSRILENGVLRFIGKRSYSFYIWHQLFVTGHFAPELQFRALATWSLYLPCAFLCACASYSFIEQPMIRIGSRLAKRAEQAADTSLHL